MTDPTKAVIKERETQGAADLAAYIRGSWDAIRQSLPDHVDPERFVRLILTEIRKSDMQKAAGVAKTSLSECSPQSIIGAILTASTLGLEIGVLGEAYLVPYIVKGHAEAQLIPGYQGITKLALQHPMVMSVAAQAVYASDEYRVSYGTRPEIMHRPGTHGDNDQPVSYYAVVTLSSGAQLVESLTASEVKALRRGRVGSSGDIPDPQHWMERKTVLRQALKLAPKSTQLAAALNQDAAPRTVDVSGAAALRQMIAPLSPTLELDTQPSPPRGAGGAGTPAGEDNIEPPRRQRARAGDSRGTASPGPVDGQALAPGGVDLATGEIIEDEQQGAMFPDGDPS